MTTALQLRRGTTAQHSSFTGAIGEVTVDTSKKTIVVHDGATPGGMPLLPKTMSDGTANGVAYLNGSKVLTTGSALTFDGATLRVKGGNANSFYVDNNGSQYTSLNFSNNGTDKAALYWDNTNANLVIGSDTASSNVIFRASNAEQMRLTSTGLGIGTSSPFGKINTVQTAPSYGSWYYGASFDSASASAIRILETTVNKGAIIGSSGGVLYIGTNASATSAGNDAMRIDSSGNLGLGVTPSAWVAKAFQIGSYVSLAQQDDGSPVLGFNNYQSSTGYKYSTTNPASVYRLKIDGSHTWYTAPSGTAGNAISFTQVMMLDASGNLGIGTSSPSGKLEVTGGIVSSGSSGSIYFKNGAGVLSNVYFDDSIAFSRSGTGERMRIDSSGNVGIGTSSPASASGGTTLSVKSSTHANMVGEVTTVDYSAIWEGRRTGRSTSARFAQVNLAVDSSDNGSVRFYTAPVNNDITERMRIDSSGNLLVGTTSYIGATPRLTLYGASTGNGIAISTSDNSYASIFTKSLDGGTGTHYIALFQNVVGTAVGQITHNGSNTTYSTSSDYRLKENIKPMQGALAVVQQLNPVTYTWKESGEAGQGFIAHELQQVVPDCVVGEKDAVDAEGNPVYQGIDTSFLVATLTKAIQELKAELDATKAEVAALKGN